MQAKLFVAHHVVFYGDSRAHRFNTAFMQQKSQKFRAQAEQCLSWPSGLGE